MSAQPSAGTLLAVSSAMPATFDAAGYAALTWTSVTDVSDIPEYGASAEVIKFNPLADRVTQKGAGAIDYGSTVVQMAYLKADAGQNILQAAMGNNNGISCRITNTDDSVDYFTAIVSSYTRNPSGVNDFKMSSVGLEINRPIVEA